MVVCLFVCLFVAYRLPSSELSDCVVSKICFLRFLIVLQIVNSTEVRVSVLYEYNKINNQLPSLFCGGRLLSEVLRQYSDSRKNTFRLFCFVEEG
jgi:hypothetical protein